jgi:hypothetical protein
MAHFAKIDNLGVVVNVTVGNDADNELALCARTDSTYRQTSYNGNFRKNYAGIGYSYDRLRDAFIPPKQYPSWVLNEDTCLWDAPTPMPDDDQMYMWNEETQAWDVNAS